mmetsp:Transcript_19876/g.43356  ORF Transcript_19876/g.43356 Transcript_19876/m.43356 type:complete len:85 (-) Transcript_19876:529-783(-)
MRVGCYFLIIIAYALLVSLPLASNFEDHSNQDRSKQLGRAVVIFLLLNVFNGPLKMTSSLSDSGRIGRRCADVGHVFRDECHEA